MWGFHFSIASGLIVLFSTKFQVHFRLEAMANPLLQPRLVVVLIVLIVGTNASFWYLLHNYCIR